MRSANLSTTFRLQKGEPNRAPATRMAQERGDSESPAMQQEIARETLQDMLLHRFNETTSDCLVHSITTETKFCSQKVLAVTQDEDRVIPIPEATLKRMHTEYGSKASNHQGHIQAGSFVEIGTDSPGCETIAEIKTHHVVEGRTIVTVELKIPDPQSNLLCHYGRMYRKGPDKRGAYHWVVYHSMAKLLLGRASGRRQFSERAHGGEQATRSLAQQTLDLWKEEAERELRNMRHMKLCLCDSQDCQQKRSREVGRAIKHVSSWKLVHEHSVEHQLAFASTTGS